MDTFLENLFAALNEHMPEASSAIFAYITFFIRLLLPILAVVIIYRCVISFLREKPDQETWGCVSLPNGTKVPLNHWENTIGRSKSSDIYLDYPTLSRKHAAIIRNADGEWTVYDLESKGGVYVNHQRIEEPTMIFAGDVISLGGVDLVFLPHGEYEEREQARGRKLAGRIVNPKGIFIYLTEFQILLCAQLCIAYADDFRMCIPISFGILIAITWAYYIFMRLLSRTGFEVEIIAFFLTTIGLGIVASSSPDGLYKQLFCFIAGLVIFLILGWFLRDLDRAKKLRWPIAIAGVILLGVNLVIAEVSYGAKNWISIAGFSVQPSEFVKICFVFAGAATLDRLFTKRNLLLFIAFSGVCVGALALMSDFGTALIFFVTYLVIAYLRSGDISTIFLSGAGAGFAGFIALQVKPYIASRFSSWGKAWEFMNDSGYQQTRTMAAAASGGLLGVGAGNGWLKGIFAADTDMVFGCVCEELGLIIGALAVLSIVALAVFSIWSAETARSSFYIIGACAASSILVFQTLLNVCGSVDILPFTGVTFPFVSKGGSSMMACWGLMAFIKAADTRQNASFAIRLPKKFRSRVREVEAFEEY